jgi:hypothetical protein
MIETVRRVRQPFRKIARAAGLSLGPVARIANANGLRRLSALDQTIKIIGDEKKPPGAMIPIDIKKRGRSQGVGHRTTGNRKGQSAPRRRKEAGNGFGISGRRRSQGRKPGDDVEGLRPPYAGDQPGHGAVYFRDPFVLPLNQLGFSGMRPFKHSLRR